MWSAAIVCLGLCAVGAVWLGFVPPLQAVVLLTIRDGQVRVRKGRLPAAAAEHVAEILVSERISRGWIAILANRRVACSRGFPADVQQRIRNVLINRDVE